MQTKERQALQRAAIQNTPPNPARLNTDDASPEMQAAALESVLMEQTDKTRRGWHEQFLQQLFHYAKKPQKLGLSPEAGKVLMQRYRKLRRRLRDQARGVGA